jgi:hypothetical protein
MSERPQTPRFFEEGPPLRDADIDAFEQRVGVPLPPEYRAFLLVHNGGRVEPATLYAYPSAAIQYFLSIGGPIDASTCWDTFRNPAYPRMPPEHFPIAECEGGDLLTMVFEGPERGHIYHWDHEEEGDDTFTYENLTVVATSLDELLAGLQPIDPDR